MKTFINHRGILALALECYASRLLSIPAAEIILKFSNPDIQSHVKSHFPCYTKKESLCLQYLKSHQNALQTTDITSKEYEALFLNHVRIFALQPNLSNFINILRMQAALLPIKLVYGHFISTTGGFTNYSRVAALPN